MIFQVVENFSEAKVDKKARASRLLRVKQAVGKHKRLAGKRGSKSRAWSRAFQGAKKVGKAGKTGGGGQAHLHAVAAAGHRAAARHGQEILHRFRPGRRGRKPYVAVRKARAGKRYYKGIVKDLKKRGYGESFLVIPNLSEAVDAKGEYKKAYRKLRKGQWHRGQAGAYWADKAATTSMTKSGLASTSKGLAAKELTHAGAQRRAGRKNAARWHARMAKIARKGEY